jgi:hypothetical protein
MMKLENDERFSNQDRQDALWDYIKNLTESSGFLTKDEFIWVWLKWGVAGFGISEMEEYFRIQNLALETSSLLAQDN